MKYADIFWVDFPGRGGHEQRGHRPAVVWQDSDQFWLPTALVIPLTSRFSALRFRAVVRIQPSAQNGLAHPSLALVFQMNAIDLKRFGARLGRLDDPDIAAIADMAKKLQRLP
jgi:mRNA interferase MazF